MSSQTNSRIVASLPLVHILARRMAASIPTKSIDVWDLVQDGVLGLIAAAQSFDEERGIKFETFATRRVHGAMLDGLRRNDTWPRGARRQNRMLDAAREELRDQLGHEPSGAELATRVGRGEQRLTRTLFRLNTIKATTATANGNENLIPSEPATDAADAPDALYEHNERCARVRHALRLLPSRERKLIDLYYYGEVMMKQIGVELGVTHRRVSQLHARAIRRLRDALASQTKIGGAD